MPQKQDIESRKDIELLVDTFYEKVLKDETIGYIFSEIANIDLAKHMPLMYDFWETTLFHKANYKGNPMKVHVDLNEKVPLKKAHFDQWLSMFNKTVDELFSGEKAELAKTRALSIATVMQIKIYQASKE
ncbi:MAG: group III truncated hemoglobin [Cyclobacteriaceae bacterium]|nr:group III truncated hemoglobin [Cyclobacteriaceae bacterium]MCK5699832.1 group III truncated hemoglobin [Cyclobacteriaceae bacterium]